MRRILVMLHRWLGLGMALFLFIAGITGALIAWEHELDAWLNPELYQSRSGGSARLDPISIAERLEQSDPRRVITYLPLELEPGRAALLSVDGRTDPATGKAHELGYDQLAVDPATAEPQQQRQWGKFALDRLHLMPFLYRLHYMLHLPDGFGVNLGIWLMGVCAVVWVLDAFIAIVIAFPSRKSWRKSFAFRLNKGAYKLNFDLHRSGGVWTWVLMLALAVTAVSMNFRREVVEPLVSLFSPLTPGPFDGALPDDRATATFDRRRIVELARLDAQREGIHAPASGLFYAPRRNIYGVGFFEPGGERWEGWGNPWLYYDAQTGARLGADLPGTGTAGDLFIQLQFPLHSGRILGLPGRILITLLGLGVGVLSLTGIVIWVRKRRAQPQTAPRLASSSRRIPSMRSVSSG
jgi:uncharacterized iron-regulated membrane protein